MMRAEAMKEKSLSPICLSLSAILLTCLVSNGAPICAAQVIYEDLKLLPDDGARLDIFGSAIAIENDIVAVGAPSDNDNGEASGSAYLMDAVTGRQIAKLLPDDGTEKAYFGSAIAISNDIIAVGAYRSYNVRYNYGAVYLFDAPTGIQTAKLFPQNASTNNDFGQSVAIDNGIVAIGAPNAEVNGNSTGAAYLFDASTGNQLGKLIPDDGATKDRFGWCIAIDNGIVAVGAKFSDHNGFNSGAAYLFDATTGAQLAKLVPDDNTASDLFGYSIAIHDGIVAVGAIGDDHGGDFAGSAYLFDASTGQQIIKLRSDKPAKHDFFGESIDIQNGITAVGVIQSSFGSTGPGIAHLFHTSTATPIAKLRATDGAWGDTFGSAISIDNGAVAVGAKFDNDMGNSSGSAYLFDVNSISNCLFLKVDNLIAGKLAMFTITGGTPGAKSITVYGSKPGQTIIYRYAGYCANFGIKGVHQDRILGGFNRTFDGNSRATFKLKIPKFLSGRSVLFQTAEHGTCPDECMSNLIHATVQ